jgi:predicted ATPase
MNEKLVVKNFGPIKEAELEIKKVTVFIGPQGSGKSTLAKLVAIFSDWKFLGSCYLYDTVNSYLEKYQIQLFGNQNTEIELKNTKFEVKYNSQEPFLCYKLLELDEKSIKLLSELKRTRTFFNSFSGMRGSGKNYYEYMKTNPVQGNYRIEFQYVLGEFLNFFKSFASSKSIKYLPTDRLLISSISDSMLGLLRAEVALQKSTIEFGGDFEIARSHLSELVIDYLNVTYKYENGRNLVFHNENDSLPLSASASGYQSTIPLHLTVEHFAKEENTHFIIEEPELNLFPTTQKQLIGYLSDRCTKGNNELLMTTHSPYVLSALNNLMFAYKVAQEVPEKAEEVAQIIPREQWLNPEDFVAYYVGEGTVRSIMDEKYGLISDNELDSISEDIAGERDVLFEILRSKKRETVN